MPERLTQPTPVSWKVIWAWTSEWQIHCEMTGGSQQDANTALTVVHLSAIVDEISRTPVLSNCRTCWMPIWEVEWEGGTRLIEVTLLLRYSSGLNAVVADRQVTSLSRTQHSSTLPLRQKNARFRLTGQLSGRSRWLETSCLSSLVWKIGNRDSHNIAVELISQRVY